MDRGRLVAVLAMFCFMAAAPGLAGIKPATHAAKVNARGGKHTPRAQKAKAGDRTTKGHGARQKHAARPDRPDKQGKNDGRTRNGGDTRDGADIAANISRNPKLKSRLEGMLPTGMTLEQAADGFRNQGQFVAAMNASKNHGIPFTELKAAMTGDNPLSLGNAIRKLKPEPTSASR